MACVKLLDHYSQFRRAIHSCKCGWTGRGAAMKNGSYTGLGIDKHCPKCGEFYAFPKFSVIVDYETAEDWPPNT
jgi:hypothetical protein